MLWAPMVGVLLAGLVSLVVGVTRWPSGNAFDSLFTAALAIAWLAFLTRGLHWDGVADVADALGSDATGERARQIMKKSDIGPFGVMAIVFGVLIQTMSLASLARAGVSSFALLLALPAARGVAASLCRPGLPVAADSSLGRWAAGRVPPAATLIVTSAAWLPALGYGWLDPDVVLRGSGAVAVLVAGGLSLLVAMWATRVAPRIGGVGGDLMGASVEATQTAILAGLVLTLV